METQEVMDSVFKAMEHKAKEYENYESSSRRIQAVLKAGQTEWEAIKNEHKRFETIEQ